MGYSALCCMARPNQHCIWRSLNGEPEKSREFPTYLETTVSMMMNLMYVGVFTDRIKAMSPPYVLATIYAVPHFLEVVPANISVLCASECRCCNSWLAVFFSYHTRNDTHEDRVNRSVASEIVACTESSCSV